MIQTSRRFFLTGLAAGIAAPMILPRSSLMAMPRAPIKTFGGAMWNGKYYPTVQAAMDAVVGYVIKEQGAGPQSIQVYQSGQAFHPAFPKWGSPLSAGHFASGDTITISPRKAPFEHVSPYKTRQDDGGFV